MGQLVFGMLLLWAAKATAKEATCETPLRDTRKSSILLQTTRKAHKEVTAANDFDEISRAKLHWVSSGQGRSTVTLPPTKEWPFPCAEARKVCFVGNEIVALEPAETARVNADEAQWTNESGASFWHIPDEHPLSWFASEQVTFNLPGYFDGLESVQRTEKPVKVRPASRTMEGANIWDAPLLNVTPVVAYPTWPFNFGDTLGRHFFHGYIDWASKHPEMYNLPLAIALPHNLLLPSFWRLLEGVGVGVESFAVLSETRDDKPLCFNKIIGCSHFDKDSNWRAATPVDSPKAWETFRTTVVHNNCPSRRASQSERSRDKQVVVGLAQRTRGRRLRNLEELLKECRALGTLGGKHIECRKVEFSDILKDLCSLQDLDVLVGTHGAQLANALFMRQGSNLIEVRANDWYDVDMEDRLKDPGTWSSQIAQSFWFTNNTRYWWYGAGAKDSFPDTRSKVPGRDSDVFVQWPILACMLEKVMLLRPDHNAYAGSALPMVRNAGCT